MLNDVWVEVNISALKHNFMQTQSALSPNTRVMAVVKANGYGHGYIEPARAFIEAGAHYLAVTRLSEALGLRQAKIKSPILLFAPIQSKNAEDAIEADLDMTIASIPLAKAISQASLKLGKIARVWVKIDTGMGRLGIAPSEAIAFFETVTNLPGIQIVGTYTHFARAIDADISPTRDQFKTFESILASLKSAGLDYGIASAANSAAIIRLPESHLDIARPGTFLYGQYPSSHVPHSLDLRPTWKLKARVCDIRDIPKGSHIGYGGEYTTNRKTRTAIVTIGLADGFTLAPTGPIYRQGILRFFAKRRVRPYMQINGVKAHVLGRVAMQMTILDVTGIEGVEVGSEVTIPAMRIPTNPLIPRVYVA